MDLAAQALVDEQHTEYGIINKLTDMEGRYELYTWENNPWQLADLTCMECYHHVSHHPGDDRTYNWSFKYSLSLPLVTLMRYIETHDALYHAEQPFAAIVPF